MKTLNATTPMTGGLSDSSEPKDNQCYVWIQDLVSGNRSRDELAEELRRNYVVCHDCASPV